MNQNAPIDRPRVVVTQPLHERVLRLLQESLDVVMNPGPEPWSSNTLHQNLADADGLMAFMTDRVSAETLAAAPRLKVIACALKGYDNFDLQACKQSGVRVSYVPDLLTEPTAELALGLAIAAGRNIMAGDAKVRVGFQGWRPNLYGKGLHGSVASVIGLGAVGLAIAERLQGFGCSKVLGVDLHSRRMFVQQVSLLEAFAQSDFVFLALPLSPHTRHLIDAALLRHAKPHMVLVNVGRGSVVRESDVADALIGGHLGSYAADVFELEDWGLDDRPRDIDARLISHPATVFTPHLGSAVKNVRLAIEEQAAAHLLCGLRQSGFQVEAPPLAQPFWVVD
jgi:phosphonate dehydrogenase